MRIEINLWIEDSFFYTPCIHTCRLHAWWRLWNPLYGNDICIIKPYTVIYNSHTISILCLWKWPSPWKSKFLVGFQTGKIHILFLYFFPGSVSPNPRDFIFWIYSYERSPFAKTYIFITVHSPWCRPSVCKIEHLSRI